MPSDSSATVTLTDKGAHDAVGDTMNSLGVDTKILGLPWDQNIKRWMSVVEVSVGVAAGGATLNYGVASIDWNAQVRVVEFMASSPRCEVRDVTIQVFEHVEMMKFPGRELCVYHGLVPGRSTSHARPDDMKALPYTGFDVMLGTTLFPATPLKREMVAGSYGVQKQIKPTPLIGGSVCPAVLVDVSVVPPEGWDEALPSKDSDGKSWSSQRPARKSVKVCRVVFTATLVRS